MSESLTQRAEQEAPEGLCDAVEALPRLVGRLAAEQSVATEVLLGLMDGGTTLDEVIEALVMHGELPAVFERPEGLTTELRLVEQPDSGWNVAI